MTLCTVSTSGFADAAVGVVHVILHTLARTTQGGTAPADPRLAVGACVPAGWAGALIGVHQVRAVAAMQTRVRCAVICNSPPHVTESNSTQGPDGTIFNVDEKIKVGVRN